MDHGKYRESHLVLLDVLLMEKKANPVKAGDAKSGV